MKQLQRRRINKIYLGLGRIVAWAGMIYLIWNFMKLNAFIIDSIIKWCCEMILVGVNTL